MEGPDPLEIAEVHPDEHRLANDVGVRDKTPIARVQGVVPVVTHHEIVPRRHLAHHALDTVSAILAFGNFIAPWNERRPVIVISSLCGLLSELLLELLHVAHGILVEELGYRSDFDGLAR
jgi:hypothetical protein